MTQTLEFLFDFGSPTTYLAHKQIPGLIERTGVKVDYVPVLLGAIFKATGNASPVAVPAKGRYMNQDMGRFAKRHGVTLNMNPYFPINTTQIMRGATALKGGPNFMAYVDLVFDAMWSRRKNMGDPAVLAEVLSAGAFDPAVLVAAAEDQAVKDALRANTEAAVARGVFGAPTFFLGEAMYFGQDRLDWIEAALLA
jgi:2-hydroxychromene-2-carboxylate isomerase